MAFYAWTPPPPATCAGASYDAEYVVSVAYIPVDAAALFDAANFASLRCRWRSCARFARK